MKKGGPEFVKRAPEGLSLFKITPPKASSFFAPRGAMCAAAPAEKKEKAAEKVVRTISHIRIFSVGPCFRSDMPGRTSPR